MNLMDYFKIMNTNDASDLFLSTCAPPSMKVYGRMRVLELPSLNIGEIRKIAYEIMNDDQKKTL